MKRLQDLTPADLDRVPVWRYEGENDDVAHVRATQRVALSADDAGAFVARTQFQLADGSQHVGFCTPIEKAGLDVLQPVIITADGPIYFFFEVPPSHETLTEQWQRLGASEDQIFPIHFRCTVPLDGAYLTGVIEAEDLTGAA
ncbi:MAG TPA: hypothetical protein VHK90_04615 [Thermoanaerobaculia bacterium]|nr:hypothetical protein [Thermoanaerobaculia bacterium]